MTGDHKADCYLHVFAMKPTKLTCDAIIYCLGTPVLTRLLATRAEDSVTLQCLTRGSPIPTQSWSRNGLDVGAGLAGHFISSDGSLVIQDHDLAQSGTYICTVGNMYGEVSATFKGKERCDQVDRVCNAQLEAWDSEQKEF